MERYVIALIAVVILFFFTCFLVSAITFICEEVNHTIKNIKKSAREFIWDLEWRFRKRG